MDLNKYPNKFPIRHIHLKTKQPSILIWKVWTSMWSQWWRSAKMLIPIQREEQGHAKCVEGREVEQTQWITLRLIILLGSLFHAVFVERFSVQEIRWQNTNLDTTGIDKRICNVCGKKILLLLSFRVYQSPWQGVGWPKSTRNISINSEIQPFHCSLKRTIEIINF